MTLQTKHGAIHRGFVIMSGLPASGKSRLGSALAQLLGSPFLDKDDFLESLYEREGVGDARWRERLSREADGLFCSAAIASQGAVLASFWRHPGRTEGGGTKSEWLTTLPVPLIEIHCDCPAPLALARFRQRNRHPGHLDAERDAEALRHKFDNYAARGALGLGTVFTVDTTGFPDANTLATRIGRVLATGG